MSWNKHEDSKENTCRGPLNAEAQRKITDMVLAPTKTNKLGIHPYFFPDTFLIIIIYYIIKLDLQYL